MGILPKGYEIAGRWKVVRRLGKGGMGSVYLCHAVADPDARFAVKVLLESDIEPGDPENRVRRFHREARVLARLEHPVIVRYEDYGSDDECHYIVMEHVNGKHLGHLMFKAEPALSNLPLDPETSIAIIRDLAEAVAAAHAAGVYHRDLKPANVMWAPDKGTKLLDFGIAMVHDATAKLTETGFAVGTATYLPPEIFFPEDDVEPDPALTDVYALGVLLQECLTGVKAFASGRLDAAKAATPHLDPGAHYPDELRAVVRSATTREPAQRTPSVAAFLGALGGPKAEDVAEESFAWAIYLAGALVAVGFAAVVFLVVSGLALLYWPDDVPEPENTPGVTKVEEDDPEPKPAPELQPDEAPVKRGTPTPPPAPRACPPREDVVDTVASYDTDLWPCVIQAFNQTANEVEKRELGARIWSVEHGRCSSDGDCAAFELFAPLFLEDATQSDPDLILQWIEHVHRKDLARHRDAIPKLVTNRIFERSTDWVGKERADKLDRAYRVYAEHMARHSEIAVEIAQAAQEWCELQKSSEIADSRCLELCEGALDTERCLVRMPYMAPVEVRCASNPRGAAEGAIAGESCTESRPYRVGTYRLTMTNDDGVFDQDIVVLHQQPSLWVWHSHNGTFERMAP